MQDMMGKQTLYDSAKEAYYNTGEQLMSDAEFDELEKELGLENSGYIGTHRQESYTVPHSFIMGSISKIQVKDRSMQAMQGYYDEMFKYLDKSKRTKHELWTYQITPKYDGCSFSAELEFDGACLKLKSVATRGDGEYGKDIKHLFEKHFEQEFAPKIGDYLECHYDEDLLYLKTLVVRGEILIDKSLFESKYSDKFTLPRSFVSGLVGQDWENTPEQQEMRDDLSFICYDYREVYENGTVIELDWENWHYIPGIKPGFWLEFKRGLVQEDSTFESGADLFNFIYDRFDKYRKEECPFALDGFVVKPFAHFRLQDMSRARQEDCVAIKFTAESVKTKLIDISWKVGKTGEYFPTAVLEDCLLGGKTISRATLHNVDWIFRNGIEIGDEVEVELAGDIIPAVRKTGVWKWDDPEEMTNVNLPANSRLEIRDGQYHLIANLSPEQQRLNSFLSSARVLKIDGVGEKVALKLWETYPDLDNIVWLFKDESLQDVIYKFGDSKSTQNIVNSMRKRRQTLTMADVVESMCFESCGEKNSIWLAKKWSGLNPDEFGIPQTVIELSKNKMAMIKTLATMKQLGVEVMKEEKTHSGQMKVILTGSPKPYYATKADFLSQHPEFIETTKWNECQMLITDDIESTSSKMQKAKKLGIKIQQYSEV